MLIIHKNDLIGATSESAIESLLKNYRDFLKRRAEGVNEPNTSPLWVQQAANEGYKYIDNTREEAAAEQEEQKKAEAENARNKLLLSAQTDEGLKDNIISAYLTDNGFPEWKLPFMQARLSLGETNQNEFDAFMEDRLSKKQEIIDEINSATS